MTLPQKKLDVNISVPEGVHAAAEELYLKLATELQRLKSKGVEPKSLRLNMMLVKECAFAVGIEELSKLGWDEFNSLCKSHNIVVRRGRC